METTPSIDAPSTPAANPPADPEATAKRYETILGLLLALFAALLALNDLGSGKYGDDELRLASEKAGAYLWYQSKGIKEALTEGQRDLLKSMIDTESLKPEQAAGTRDQLKKLEAKIARYDKEKKEILLGSAKVGKDGWMQEVDGQLGKVVGVKEIETQLEVLGAAGDRFDLATLFLQICLVVGAIGLLLKQLHMKRLFLGVMLGLGSIGLVFSILAYVKVGLL